MPTTSRPRPACGRDRCDDPHRSRRRARLRPDEPFDDGGAELGAVSTIRALHIPGHPPRTRALRADRHLTRRRALGRPDSATRRSSATSRGPIWPSTRRRARAASSVPAREADRRCPRPCEVWPGTLGGSLLRRSRHGHEGLLDDRVRARQPDLLRIDRRGRLRCARPRRLGPQPPNFENIVALTRGPLSLEDIVDAHRSPRARSQQARLQGALVVDVRTDLAVRRGHIPGAVASPPLRAGFGSKLAWIAKPGQPLVLVGRDDEDALEAAALAGAVGLSTIAGYLAGGMTSWREEMLPVARVARMTVPQLHDLWQTADGELQILDVREQAEWDGCHIPGSVHRPTTTSTRCPTASTRPSGRRDLRLRPALRRRSQPAEAPRRRRSSMWSTVACRMAPCGLADRAARPRRGIGRLV